MKNNVKPSIAYIKESITLLSQKTMLFFRFLCVSFAVCFVSYACSLGEPKDSEQDNSVSSITGNVSEITAISATLGGSANIIIGNSISTDFSMGIMFSTSSGTFPFDYKKIQAKEIDNSFNYSIHVSDLTPSSTYSYRSYVTVDNHDYLGDIKSFMTKDISSLVQTCEACELESATVSLSATFDLIVINESLSYGFCFGSTEEALDTFIDGDYLTGNSFFASVNNLAPFSKYYYKAWIEINEQKFFGEIKSFTTNGIPVNSVSLNIHDNTIHKIGEAFKLVATIVPEDASEKGLKWISSNESVAKVDDEGNVTAVGNGTTQITVITNNNSKEDVCNLVVSQWVEDITLNWNNVMCHVGETPRCVATVRPSNAENKTIRWSSSNTSVLTIASDGTVSALKPGKVTIYAVSTDGSKKYNTCSMWVREGLTAVDLGLSVKWANMNLGADYPERVGSYYAWGETFPKQEYSWINYKWSNGSAYSLTKYVTSSNYGSVDNKTTLEPEDDAAYINLGEKWRMPTTEELQELIDKCRTQLTELNGVSVIRFFRNGQSIYLPFSGYYQGTKHIGQEAFRSSIGLYQSSSLKTYLGSDGSSCASYLYVRWTSSLPVQIVTWDRCYGITIRPVMDY